MFTFTPKHARLINACYGPDQIVNLSVLIHHICLKPERITKITSYLITKIIDEIVKTNQCSTTTAIILAIISRFNSKSALYEVNILKALTKAILKITNKNMKDDSSSIEFRVKKDCIDPGKYDYNNFRNLLKVVEHFKCGMKSYDGEKHATKLLFLLCECAFHEFFIDMLCGVIRIKGLFHNGYEKKIVCCVEALMVEKWVDRIVCLCEVINIVNVRIFCYEMVKRGCEKNIDVEFVVKSLKNEMGVFAIVEINHYLIENIEKLRAMIDDEQVDDDIEEESQCSDASIMSDEPEINASINLERMHEKITEEDNKMTTSNEDESFSKSSVSLKDKLKHFEEDIKMPLLNEAELSAKSSVFVKDKLNQIEENSKMPILSEKSSVSVKENFRHFDKDTNTFIANKGKHNEKTCLCVKNKLNEKDHSLAISSDEKTCECLDKNISDQGNTEFLVDEKELNSVKREEISPNEANNLNQIIIIKDGADVSKIYTPLNINSDNKNYENPTDLSCTKEVNNISNIDDMKNVQDNMEKLNVSGKKQDDLIFVYDIANDADIQSLEIKIPPACTEIKIQPIFEINTFDNKHREMILLITWSSNLLPKYITHSVIELGQSFFTLLRGLFTNGCKIPHKKSFIFKYMKNFLNNCSVTSDILYIYIKKALQYNFTPNSIKISSYSLEFQTAILRLAKEYSQKYILILDPKFISLLIKISENVFTHAEQCYQILLNAIRGAMPGGESGHALHAKIRSIYFYSGDPTLYKILKIFVRFLEDKEQSRETLKVMKYIHEKFRHDNYDELKRMCRKTGNEDVLTLDEVVYSKKDEDLQLYEEIYGVLYRLYSHSLKSSYNLESLAQKRKTKIKGIKFFKR